MVAPELRLKAFRSTASHIKIHQTSAAEPLCDVPNLEMTHLSEAAPAGWLLAENGSSRDEAHSVAVSVQPN
jgi:hypothetical protein